MSNTYSRFAKVLSYSVWITAFIQNFAFAHDTAIWDCNGIVTNGYGKDHPSYKEIYTDEHVVAINCRNVSAKNNYTDCWFHLDLLKYKSTMWDNGNTFSIGGTFVGDFSPVTGYLLFRINESDNLDTNRWFEAFCIRR